MVFLHLYLLCYNESILIGPTIDHYQNRFPNVKITILDNESTDNSAEIAISKNCSIHYWSSSGIDDNKYIEFKNNIWKDQSLHDDIWVIVADMDEWLSITEEELQFENDKGTTVISTLGYNIVGNSLERDLIDIHLHSLDKGIYWPDENKSICFKRSAIQEMNYQLGAHTCNPIGNIVYSERKYILKHMEPLGLPFMIHKFTERYKRTEKKRNEGEWWAGLHYSDNVFKIKSRYDEQYNGAVSINSLL
jgi:glycosyltransferase involved in cell wall biosynthesis